jgi:hypothetical protein
MSSYDVLRAERFRVVAHLNTGYEGCQEPRIRQIEPALPLC